MADGKGFDFIVVGGGSAGCVLASRLTEDPAVRVLLIEAGPRDTSPLIAVPGGAVAVSSDPGLAWGYKTEPQPELAGRSLSLTQAKVLGGGSSINGMVSTRGAARDFDAWAKLGAEGWGYTDLLPWFRKSEASERGDGPYHGADGPIGIARGRSPLPIVRRLLEALDQCGYPLIDDLNVPSPDGFGYFDWAIRKGRRASTASSYAGIRKARPNLTVQTGAVVTRVIVEGGRAVGVELAEAGKTSTIRCDREVLVAAGAIGSAKLLLLSGIGNPDALRALSVPVTAELPAVGANLQNHVCYRLEFGISEPISAFRYMKPWTGAVEGLRYFLRRDGFLAAGMAAAGGFFRSFEELSAPDMQLFLVPALIGGGDTVRGKLPQRDGFTMMINQGRPFSRGRVTLRSADPLEPPSIDPAYLSDPRDLAAMAGGAARMRALADAPALRRLIDAFITPGPDARTVADLAGDVRQNADNYYHVAGTCRIGADAGDSVVDTALRVHGVARLRIADASVMPTLVNGNTNAAVVAIAERAANLILAG